jgi:hypothetical protein
MARYGKTCARALSIAFASMVVTAALAGESRRFESCDNQMDGRFNQLNADWLSLRSEIQSLLNECRDTGDEQLRKELNRQFRAAQADAIAFIPTLSMAARRDWLLRPTESLDALEWLRGRVHSSPHLVATPKLS